MTMAEITDDDLVLRRWDRRCFYDTTLEEFEGIEEVEMCVFIRPRFHLNELHGTSVKEFNDNFLLYNNDDPKVRKLVEACEAVMDQCASECKLISNPDKMCTRCKQCHLALMNIKDNKWTANKAKPTTSASPSL